MSNYKCDWCNRIYVLTTDTPCYDKWAFCWEPCKTKWMERQGHSARPSYDDLRVKVEELKAQREKDAGDLQGILLAMNRSGISRYDQNAKALGAKIMQMADRWPETRWNNCFDMIPS